MSSKFNTHGGIISDDYIIKGPDHKRFAMRGNTKDYAITLPALNDVPDSHEITIMHQNAGDFEQHIVTATIDRKGDTVTDTIDNNNSPMLLTHTGMTVKLIADTDAKKWWPEIIYWAGNVG